MTGSGSRRVGRPKEDDPRKHRKVLLFNDDELTQLRALSAHLDLDFSKTVRLSIAEAAEKHLPKTLVLTKDQQSRLEDLAEEWGCTPEEALTRILKSS